MPQFFATTPRGLENVLSQELTQLGLKNKPGIAGVYFQSNWAGCYKANLELVSASRVLYPVLDFPAYEPDQIYHNVLKHDWTKYIDPQQTIAMDSSCRDSKIKDLRIIALKAKDAVADQFREKYGVRPDVNPDNPDLQISLRLAKNMCTVSLDTSGGSLHMRGYRDRGAPAPLKENLAAALVKLTGWDQKSPLIDPMCGSGTFCIEAALMALGRAPGTFKKKFGFQKWKTFQKEVFEAEVDSVTSRELDDVPFRIYGYDADGRAIAASKAHSDNAETSTITLFKKQEFHDLQPAPTPGVVIVNPPYGERLGAGLDLHKLYAELGQVLSARFRTNASSPDRASRWRAYALVSEPELARAFVDGVGLKPAARHRVYNGAIECQFIGFDL